MRNSRLNVDLLHCDRVWMGRVAHPDSINDQSWVTLLRGVVHSGVHVTVEASGIAETEPVEIVLRNTRHEHLDNIRSIRDIYLRWAVSGSNDAIECGRDEWISRKAITNDSLN